mmetsp:Transcript_44354/g.96496  ORF Transcript_44354/g.96496 Transcript_44354/m.96496 type:complete len:222 (-) Transcript_44354:620-1285(-)
MRVAASAVHLHRRDVLTLHSGLHEVFRRVVANLQLRLPAGVVAAPEELHGAVSAVVAVIHALLRAVGLLSEALLLVLVGAPYLASGGSLSAHCTADVPLAGHPLLALGVAHLLRGWLAAELALLILPGGAQHLAGLVPLPAALAAGPPVVDHPPGPVGGELLLHRLGRGQRRQLVGLGAAEGPLAGQMALRLGAHGGVLAIPGATRAVADVGARHVVAALQ